jgi:hypothetical protein
MRLEIAAHAPRVRVTLSRRNLMALLVKLDGWPTDSECSITLGQLLVHAEPDEVHYADRPPAGAMHPLTEEAINFQEELK